MSERGARVLVVGSLNVDLVVRVPRHPRPGETVLGGDLARFAGGKGANQAAAAALAASPGVVVSLLGRHGDDADGSFVRAALAVRGVDLASLRVDARSPTGVALITVDGDGQNAIVVSGGANARLSARDVDEALEARPPTMVLAQLETPAATIAHLALRCAASGVPLVLNAAPPTPLPDVVWSALDTLVVNEHEAGALGGEALGAGARAPRRDAGARRALALDAAESLAASRGIARVIVTLGGDGVAWGGESRGTAPAFEIEVRDTTGAGDAFCGAYVAARASGVDTAAAIALGSAAGALAVSRLGAIAGLPRRDEIEALLNR